MIKNSVLLILSICLGVSVTVGAYLLINRQSVLSSSPSVASKFSLEKPPTDALSGEVTALSGKVVWQSRLPDQAPILLTGPRKVQQGEEIDTDDKASAVISFPDIATISASAKTQINIVQTLPANIVIQQKQGTAVYDKGESAIPVSVRELDLLVNLGKGQSSITLDKDKQQVTVAVKTGQVTISYTDTQNVTQVQDIKKGQRIVFDNNTKKITP